MANGPVPRVAQLILCQSAAFDEVANAWVLVHPLSQLRVQASNQDPFPHLVERWALYFQLTGLTQPAMIHVEIKGPSTIAGFHTDFRSPGVAVNVPPNPTTIENVVQLKNVPLLEAGTYTVYLRIDGQFGGDRSALELDVTGETLP